VAPWDESVQHLRLTGVRMDRPARLFVCARCRVQVVLCSHCDRGQRYCSPSCSRQARQVAQRETQRRYQASRVGRMAHARRARLWRIRHHSSRIGARATRAAQPQASSNEASSNIVTHQGSQDRVADAPLAAWRHASATSNLRLVTQTCTAVPSAPHDGAQRLQTSAGPARCRRCGAALLPWVRQDFLRRFVGKRIRLRHDHSP
jgi:hypothetical protein